MITEEEINKILLSSPMVLPNSPADAGMSASGVKELFYKYIRVLIKTINLHLEALENHTLSSVSEHNTGTEAHADIRMLISELRSSATQSYKLLSEALSSHNDETASHPYLRTWLKQLERDLQDVHNLASGKSKIYPVADIYEMLGMLTDELNVGDKFVLATEGVPDFILFEKNSTRTNVPTLSTLDIMLGLELEAGKFYICNGFLFVATECGIDTSLFAKKTDISTVNQALQEKETSFKKQIITTNEVTLNNKVEYNLGLCTSVVLSLPDEYDSGFETLLVFKSGAEATTIEAPEEIIFTQDDCSYGKLTPVPNRIYEISIKSICGTLVARVASVDYEVIE